MSDNLSLDPKTTAVVLIEYQNDFTSDGGALHGAVADVMDSTGMLDNLKDCVAATSQAEHDNAITYDFPMFSVPVSAETVIAALSPSASDAA
jgi:nicotinamidase-related amidase